MDIETSEVIASLRGDIQRVEATLSGEIGKLRGEMVTRDFVAGLATREELETGLTSVRNELKSGLASVRGELESGLTSVRGELVSMRDELKRHTDMRFESLHDDIRIIAEGFASLNARMDRAER